METDPNYEYEAPKWFDFTTDFENEVDENLSLNDSWFERVHPLHEPRDPSHHDATTKPLIAGNQGNGAAPSSSRPQAKNPTKKNCNSKKSLGIKTVGTKRGQHENLNYKESSCTGPKNGKLHAQKTAAQTTFKGGKKDSSGNSKEDGRTTPDETSYSFASPWTNSPVIKQEETSHTNEREESSSSLSEVAAFSPQRVPVNSSPLTPTRVQTLKSSVSSSSPGSPKTSLLSKAVSGTVKQAGRKRRLLPSIPDSKQKQVGAAKILSSSGQCSSQLADHGANKKPVEASELLSSASHCCDQTGDGAKKKMPNLSKRSENMDKKAQLVKETEFGGSSKPIRTVDTVTGVNIGTLNQAQHCDGFNRQEKNALSQRSLGVIPENFSSKGIGSEAFAPTESAKQTSSKCETDASLEELLRQHNKKIAAARNQYDENGRRIRTAEPSFCPAPVKKSASSLKLSSSLSSTASCKRPASSMEKPTVSSKQKRRSCMAAVSNVQSESTRSSARSMPSNTHTNVNKKGKGSLNQQTAKQKRRSCMASLQNSEQANTSEKELQDLIAQHNSRVRNAKRP